MFFSTNKSIPSSGSIHYSLMWPVASYPYWNPRSLNRTGQEYCLLQRIVSSVISERLATPQSSKHFQGFVDHLSTFSNIDGFAEVAETPSFVFDIPQTNAQSEATFG